MSKIPPIPDFYYGDSEMWEEYYLNFIEFLKINKIGFEDKELYFETFEVSINGNYIQPVKNILERQFSIPDCINNLFNINGILITVEYNIEKNKIQSIGLHGGQLFNKKMFYLI